MPTLAELTLTLSQDITRNEHERAIAVAALDGERMTALAALAGAGVPLRRHAEALVAAQAERDETVLDIEVDLREAERLATNRRRADEDAAEQRLRDADDAAGQTRRLAEDKARATLEAAELAIDRRNVTPGEKVLARAEARRVLNRAVGAAQEAFADARLANQDRLLDDRRAAMLGEGRDSRDNRDKAAARRSAAEYVFGQTVRAGDTALQAALAALPGAAAVIASFAERRAGVERRFDEQEAALHAAFRTAREALRDDVSLSRRRA